MSTANLPPASQRGNAPRIRITQTSLFHTETYQGEVYDRDICANRHGGAETSREAHERVRPHKREVYERILAIVRERGSATVHELSEALATYPSSISGRLSELKILGRLTYALDAAGKKIKRRGAAALVATEK